MIEARFRRHVPGRGGAAEFHLDVALETGAGVTALVGAAGAGKTMTLEAISGFLRPAEGRIAVGEQVVFDHARNIDIPPERRRCAYVPAAPSLFPHLTVRQNLEFGAGRLARLERHRRVGETLERFSLGEAANRYPRELGAEAALRATIARAVLPAPLVVVIDQPERGLDGALRGEMTASIRLVRQVAALPVLVATRSFDLCFEAADEVYILEKGRVIQTGAPRRILEQPASLEVAAMLGVFNLLPVEIVALDPGRNTSVLRYRGAELEGPYLAGHFKGDRVTAYVRNDALALAPVEGRPGRGQVPAAIERVTERAESMRVEVSGGLTVIVPRPQWERQKHNKEWVVEIPSAAIRVF